MSLLRASNTIPANSEEKYTLPKMHVPFSKQEKAAQLNGLFKGKRLRVMLDGKVYYVAEVFFPFISSLTDKSLGFGGRCKLTQLILQ